jgi:phenylacetate-CoA ligase
MKKIIRLLYDLASKTIVWPFIFLYSKDFSFPLYRKMLQHQTLSFHELRELQFDKLKELLIYANEFVPYYSGLFKKIRFDPFEFKSFEDIEQIPLLTKEIIRVNYNDLISKEYRKEELRENSSGGSTGNPLNFYQDKRYWKHTASATFVSDKMQGWDFGKRTAFLWGAPRDAREVEGIVNNLKLTFLNQRWYNSFNMSENNMFRFHEDMTSFMPNVLIAYASSVYIYSKFLKGHGIIPRYPTVSIITSAETLHDFMRKSIEDVFQKPVFNRYGSREAGIIASQCSERQGLHVHMDNIYIESIDPSSLYNVCDEIGELVVTPLMNFAMPFIRYRIGDMGIKTRALCSCGFQSELIDKVVGRISDTIRTKSGRLIHGEYFTHAFYGVNGIKQFQFIQESLDKFRVLIVKTDTFDHSALRRVESEILEVLDPESTVDFEFVGGIDSENSGKYRFTISKVPITGMDYAHR